MRPLVVRFVAPRVVEVHEMELPKPAENELSVRTLYSGISSGTEMLAYRGELDPSLLQDETIGALGGTFTYPFEYGYSAVGVVESGGRDLAQGSTVFSFRPHRSHFVARRDELVPLGDIDPRRATLFPLVETAFQISLDAGDVRDRQVVVLGSGPVGILSATLLKRAGAHVLAIDPVESRRAAASAFGIHGAHPEEAAALVDERTGGRGVALVVEATGNPEAVAAALLLLAHEGELLVCSWFGTKVVPLPLGGDFHRRRLTIRSSQVSSIPSHLQREWSITRRRDATLDLLRELPLEVLATHTFPVQEAAAAFAAIDEGSEGLLHAALSYG
jgi:2-desacetyl-2-hydroxyethyl bacteriochlorophyllide A dehydrogenase